MIVWAFRSALHVMLQWGMATRSSSSSSSSNSSSNNSNSNSNSNSSQAEDIHHNKYRNRCVTYTSSLSTPSHCDGGVMMQPDTPATRQEKARLVFAAQGKLGCSEQSAVALTA